MKNFLISEELGQKILNYIVESNGNVKDALFLINTLKGLKPFDKDDKE